MEEHVKVIMETYDGDPSIDDVIEYLQDNYEEITGEDRKNMYAEQEFDYALIEIVEECGFDYDDLCYNW